MTSLSVGVTDIGYPSQSPGRNVIVYLTPVVEKEHLTVRGSPPPR